MKDKSTKRLEAEKRQEKYNSLTPKEKIESLNNKFGKGIGAEKERKRLKAQINKKEK